MSSVLEPHPAAGLLGRERRPADDTANSLRPGDNPTRGRPVTVGVRAVPRSSPPLVEREPNDKLGFLTNCYHPLWHRYALAWIAVPIAVARWDTVGVRTRPDGGVENRRGTPQGLPGREDVSHAWAQERSHYGKR